MSKKYVSKDGNEFNNFRDLMCYEVRVKDSNGSKNKVKDFSTKKKSFFNLFKKKIVRGKQMDLKQEVKDAEVVTDVNKKELTNVMTKIESSNEEQIIELCKLNDIIVVNKSTEELKMDLIKKAINSPIITEKKKVVETSIPNIKINDTVSEYDSEDKCAVITIKVTSKVGEIISQLEENKTLSITKIVM